MLPSGHLYYPIISLVPWSQKDRLVGSFFLVHRLRRFFLTLSCSPWPPVFTFLWLLQPAAPLQLQPAVPVQSLRGALPPAVSAVLAAFSEGKPWGKGLHQHFLVHGHRTVS